MTELTEAEQTHLHKLVLAGLKNDEAWLEEIAWEYVEGCDQADYLDWRSKEPENEVAI